MKIYIVNGAPGSGKTTFEELIRQFVGVDKCFNLSTIDFVKTLASLVGWDGRKTPRSRKLLSNLKHDIYEWNPDFFVNRTKELIDTICANYEPEIIMIDCREPVEIKKFCERLGAKSIIVRRAEAEEKVVSNDSDRNVLEYDYDISIDNNGALVLLEHCAQTFLEQEKIHFDKNKYVLNLNT